MSAKKGPSTHPANTLVFIGDMAMLLCYILSMNMSHKNNGHFDVMVYEINFKIISLFII